MTVWADTPAAHATKVRNGLPFIRGLVHNEHWLDHAFHGYRAAVLGHGADRCPYHEGSTQAAAWARGHAQATEDMETRR